jgi:hypothetical protein
MNKDIADIFRQAGLDDYVSAVNEADLSGRPTASSAMWKGDRLDSGRLFYLSCIDEDDASSKLQDLSVAGGQVVFISTLNGWVVGSDLFSHLYAASEVGVINEIISAHVGMDEPVFVIGPCCSIMTKSKNNQIGWAMETLRNMVSSLRSCGCVCIMLDFDMNGAKSNVRDLVVRFCEYELK